MPTLNWIGKEAFVKHHKEVPHRLLELVAELSSPLRPLAGEGLKKRGATTKNLRIQSCNPQTFNMLMLKLNGGFVA